LTGLDVNGNIIAANITANTGIFSGNAAGLTNIPSGNLSGQVANALVAGTVYTNAQPNITSVGTLSALSVTGNANVGNVGASAGIFTTVQGSLTTASQPNVTSVGTLTSLAVTGNVSAANLTGNHYGNGASLEALNASNVTSGTLAQARLANSSVTLGSTALTLGSTVTTVAGLTSVTSTTFVGALTGAATSATTAGTVTTAAQPNITSVGTLTSLAVTGNATAGNVYANSGTIGASLLTGTLTTAAQPNVTSVGTLSSLSVTGNISAGNVNATTFTGTLSGAATSATTAGTVTTAAQPNVTSVGTLTSLAVSNIAVNSSCLNVTGIEVPFKVIGSSTGYVQGAICLSSGTADGPGSRGQGVFLFNEGNDTTWYVGTAYAAADTFYITRKSSTTTLDTSAAQSGSALLTLTNAGALTVASVTETSSIALKENINPITNALDLIQQLVGVTYDRKDGSKKNEAGLVAEDVEKILPNLIGYDENGKPVGIHYTKLTAYLIEAVKELTGKIKRLENK
jgi:hypothetical protein